MSTFEPLHHIFEASLACLPPERAEPERVHAEGVAACAVRLAELRGEDPPLAEAAALLHDLGRAVCGDAEKTHGRTGAAWLAPQLGAAGVPPVGTRDRLLRAIRRHGRKSRVDDTLTELLKDADVWQLSRQGGSFASGSPRAVRLLVTEQQLACGSADPMAGWPAPESPGRIAGGLRHDCLAFADGLSVLMANHRRGMPPGRHAVHAIRLQARAMHALLGFLAPWLHGKRYRRMRKAAGAVLDATGPVRDLDVLTQWLQLSSGSVLRKRRDPLPDASGIRHGVSVRPPEGTGSRRGEPDMSPEAVAQRASVPNRIAAERGIRLRKAMAHIRSLDGSLALFTSPDLFRELDDMSSESFAAYRDTLVAGIRRRMTADAARLADAARARKACRIPAHERHRLRIRTKQARILLECLYEHPHGTHPLFSALTSALAELSALLGAHQDTVACSRLLHDMLEKERKDKRRNADLHARWRSHCTKQATRLAHRVPAACFAIRKLF